MLREASPTFGPTQFALANPPPSPPFSAHNDPLDDIYGSEPSSPLHEPEVHGQSAPDRQEMLSDLPSRQRAIDTDAYREGLSNSKGQYVQEGFDEGFSLGANLGQRVGYILGALQGFVAALQNDEKHCLEISKIWDNARLDLAIENLLGQDWVDEEGIWKWPVKGSEEDVTFREVAAQHPTIIIWSDRLASLALEVGADLHAMQDDDEGEVEEQS